MILNELTEINPNGFIGVGFMGQFVQQLAMAYPEEAQAFELHDIEKVVGLDSKDHFPPKARYALRLAEGPRGYTMFGADFYFDHQGNLLEHFVYE